MTKRGASGGKAEATGGDYETRVAAWYCARVLLGGAAQPLFDLPADVRLISASCQTDAPVDDVNVKTSDDGRIFVQAKRTVYLSDAGNSALVKSLDQFVRQHKSCAENSSTAASATPLDSTVDRLVLTTRRQSGAKITEVLPRLLRGLRDRTEAKSLVELQTSSAEKEVAETIESILRDRWMTAYGVAASQDELAALLRLIWIEILDVEDNQTDALALLDFLRSVVLATPVQAGLAFAELIKLCGRLRADRSGTDLASIQRVLSLAGVSLLALPDYRADIAALKKWSQARLQRVPRYTRLLEDDARTIVRRRVQEELRTAALSGSLVLVGDPGAGKSGLAYGLASDLIAARRDVVFLPVDLFNVSRISDVANELDLQYPLPEVLANWPGDAEGLLVRAEFQDMVSVLDEIALRFHLSVGGIHDATAAPLSPEQVRLFHEALPMLETLTTAGFSQITHHLIQMLEAFIPVDPPETFRLIAQAVRTSERYGYGVESMASDLVVRIVEQYLADHREVFAERNRLDDLMDCLDVFVRAGWPNAQALTFRLGEIWR
jgi:hypothetical protein